MSTDVSLFVLNPFDNPFNNLKMSVTDRYMERDGYLIMGLVYPTSIEISVG